MLSALKKILPFSLIFLLFLSILALIIVFVRTDINSHSVIALDIRNGVRPVEIPFLYFFLLIGGTLFSTNIEHYNILAVFILAILTSFRFYVIQNIYESELRAISDKAEKSRQFSWTGALLLLFSFSIPTTAVFDKGYFYMGTIPPNVWHNSTTILVLPFVLLLFWLSLKQLLHFENRRLLYILGLIVLNVISKPSFLFVYIPAYTIMVLWTYKWWSVDWWKGMMPVFFSILCVGINFVTLYVFKSTSDNNSVGINFFYIIRTYLSQDNNLKLLFFLIQQFVFSFFFPIVFLFRHKELLKDKRVFFVVLSVVFSLLIYHTLIEAGSRAKAGNFGWQSIISNHILFFVCILELLRLIAKNNYTWKPYKLEVYSLFIHVFFGVVYISKCIVSGLMR